jgi:hypothetical protein
MKYIFKSTFKRRISCLINSTSLHYKNKNFRNIKKGWISNIYREEFLEKDKKHTLIIVDVCISVNFLIHRCPGTILQT